MVARCFPVNPPSTPRGRGGMERNNNKQIRPKRCHGNQLLSNCGVLPVSPVAAVTSGNRGKSKTISDEKETLERKGREKEAATDVSPLSCSKVERDNSANISHLLEMPQQSPTRHSSPFVSPQIVETCPPHPHHPSQPPGSQDGVMPKVRENPRLHPSSPQAHSAAAC